MLMLTTLIFDQFFYVWRSIFDREHLKSDATSKRFLCLFFITAMLENPDSHK